MRRALMIATALVSSAIFLVPGAVVAQSTVDWSGPYLGATIGFLRSESSILFTPSSFSAVDVPFGGATGGVAAGYNWDLGNIVAGVEADASLAAASGSFTSSGDDFTAGLSSLLTFRGRLGFEAGNALIYGTAGVAAGNVSISTQIDSGAVSTAGGFRTGGVAGVGVELALNDNVSIKTEGLAYQLASVNGVGDNGKGTAYSSSYKPTGVTVKSGVNFRF